MQIFFVSSENTVSSRSSRTIQLRGNHSHPIQIRPNCCNQNIACHNQLTSTAWGVCRRNLRHII